jgi:uncharacterized protein
MVKIIGRTNETKILKSLATSNNPEFLALYGRRRVGKTFLIKNFFKNKKFVFFSMTGEKNAPMSKQIKHFTDQIGSAFYNGAQLAEGKNWDETFKILTSAFDTVSNKEKIILFFDEFPWMATQNSNLLQNLDYYWNQHWSNDSRIKLIICGSSASWIIDNIVNNTGGLHNRITKHICLEPLNLPETKNFLEEKGVSLSNKHIIDLYMSMGGVPHYLNQIEKGMSATQNIESLAFNRKGFLLQEFDNLFSSLFKNSEIYEDIIKIVAAHRYGIGKRELLAKLGKSQIGKGGLEKLQKLEESGFILSFKPHLHKEKGIYYKVIDPYSLFYLYWIFPVRSTLIVKSLAKGYWDKTKKSPSWQAWSGLAFEAICYDHLPQISHALKLSPTAIPTTWRYTPRLGGNGEGAQIDLLFDRDDDAITICEIKYSDKPYVITKDYAKKLEHRVEIFKKITHSTKQIFTVMISANGVKKNKYSEELISGVVTLEDLFKIVN